MHDFPQLGSCVAQPEPASSRGENQGPQASRRSARRARELEVLRGLPGPTLGSPRPSRGSGLGVSLGARGQPWAAGPRAGQGGAKGYFSEIAARSAAEMGELDEPVVGERWRRGCVVWGKVILNLCKTRTA